MNILRTLDWVRKEETICNYVSTMEHELKREKDKNKFLKDNLHVCPMPTLGDRYNDILVPDWVQFDDMEQLGKDFNNYLNTIAPYRRP